MKQLLLFLLLGIALFTFVNRAISQEEENSSTETNNKRPNFWVIIVDDMGYSDLGCYGGEIETPQIDSLAHEGIRFTSFCNTARCWPSRSSLMTGYYAQQMNMDPVRPPHPNWITYLPQHLHEVGYRNYHSGKWHVETAPRVIADAGFDESYYSRDHNRYFAPQDHRRNDQPLDPVAEAGDHYSTTYIAQQTIDQLADHAINHGDTPFFAYTAFLAPHFPLMALPEDIAKYADRYQVGWDIIREKRHERMTQSGICQGELSQREEHVGPPYRFEDTDNELGDEEVYYPLLWDSLTPPQQRFQADKMAIHAAMVDRIDQEVGRVIEQLRQMDALDNTVIFFLSDNGASAEIMIRGDRHDRNAPPGSAKSFLCLGPGWSTAANTPFRRHKTWVHEGGISTPLVVYAPKLFFQTGKITNQPGHLVDLAPTILELSGAPLPTAMPYPGKSLVPVLMRGETYNRGPLFFCHDGNKAIKDGQWKAVMGRIDQIPGEEEKWELYDLATDRAEQHDLASRYPEQLQKLKEQWQTMNDQFASDANQ